MCEKTSDNGKLAWSNGYLGCLLEEAYKDHGLEGQRIVGSGRRRLVEMGVLWSTQAIAS
jgi:hypothetical protein